MSDVGDPGARRSTAPQPLPPIASTALAELREHGRRLGLALQRQAPGTRAAGSGWRAHAHAASRLAGGDPEIHRILVDVEVAAQHLTSRSALWRYARTRRDRAATPESRALVDGLLAALEGPADDARATQH
jgi:hypothetical protein